MPRREARHAKTSEGDESATHDACLVSLAGHSKVAQGADHTARHTPSVTERYHGLSKRTWVWKSKSHWL